MFFMQLENFLLQLTLNPASPFGLTLRVIAAARDTQKAAQVSYRQAALGALDHFIRPKSAFR